MPWGHPSAIRLAGGVFTVFWFLSVGPVLLVQAWLPDQVPRFQLLSLPELLSWTPDWLLCF